LRFNGIVADFLRRVDDGTWTRRNADSLGRGIIGMAGGP
jgi:hypothetical protein